MFSSPSYIKKKELCWLCWHWWSRLLPHLSGGQVHVTGPPSSRRSSSCRRWPLWPPSLRSCWMTTCPVRVTRACCSCWTGASGKVRMQQSMGRDKQDQRDPVRYLKGQRSNANIHVSCQSALEQNTPRCCESAKRQKKKNHSKSLELTVKKASIAFILQLTVWLLSLLTGLKLEK